MKPHHLVLLAMLAAPATSFAKEEKAALTLEQIPAEAAKPILAAAGKAPLTLKKEKEDGVEAYEAKWEAGGHKHEITVTPAGAVLSEEEIVALESAPEAVRTAIKAAGGDLIAVEKITEKGATRYEAAFKVEEGKLEVKYDASGKELKRETEKKKAHKEEKEDGDVD